MISLVIPVFNEEENLSALMDRIRPVMSALKRPWEIILVDDGSRDRSLEILKGFTVDPEVRVVELTRNYGQHAAILAGFSIVRGGIVVTLDADLQNPPEEIPRLIDTMEEGGYDVVGTIRRGKKGFPAPDHSLPDRQYGGAKNHRRPDDRLGLHAPGLPPDGGGADDRLPRTCHLHSGARDAFRQTGDGDRGCP